MQGLQCWERMWTWRPRSLGVGSGPQLGLQVLPAAPRPPPAPRKHPPLQQRPPARMSHRPLWYAQHWHHYLHAPPTTTNPPPSTNTHNQQGHHPSSTRRMHFQCRPLLRLVHMWAPSLHHGLCANRVCVAVFAGAAGVGWPQAPAQADPIRQQGSALRALSCANTASHFPALLRHPCFFIIGFGCSIGVGDCLDGSALVWTCVFRPRHPATRSSQSQRLHPWRPSVDASPGVHTHSRMSWCLRSALAAGRVVKQLGVPDHAHTSFPYT